MEYKKTLNIARQYKSGWKKMKAHMQAEQI